MATTAPSGVVCFLFTDIEGSTRLWAADTEAMSASLVQHDDILRRHIDAHRGYVFTTAGDSFAVAFGSAQGAVAAAVAAQAELRSVDWSGPALRVRMGLHVGEAEERGGDYFGPVVNTCARVEAAGHGGQILITESVQAVAGAATAVDLGIHRLRDVPDEMRLFQLGTQSFPPLRGVLRNHDNLPRLRHRLIGRDTEVDTLTEATHANRLVTAVGPGGIGKTSVVIEAAGRLVDRYPGGVHFVDLTESTQGSGVLAGVARALRLSQAPDLYGHVVDFLSGTETLVVVDNCEHVIDDAADVIDRLLGDVASLTILATSREHLDIEGEHVVRIDPLPTEVGSAGVRLFVERALAVAPDFASDDTELQRVATICRRLDGVPLALELAAARTRSMSLIDIEQLLDDRLSLLAGGRRGKLRRQQTIRATLEWSIELLESGEVDLLARLAVFVGGFDLEGAAAVGGMTRAAALQTVGSLHDKSLVLRVDDVHGKARYRLLETVREWGFEHLARRDELQDARDRHAGHFVEQLAYIDPLQWASVNTDCAADVHDIAVAVEHLCPTDATAAALVTGAAALELGFAGHLDAAATATDLHHSKHPTEWQPRVWTSRRRVQLLGMTAAGTGDAPPSNDGSRDWRLLVGDATTDYSGLNGWMSVWSAPASVLNAARDFDPVGSNRDDIAARAAGLDAASDAAFHLGAFEECVELHATAMQIETEAGIVRSFITSALPAVAMAAVVASIDVRGHPISSVEQVDGAVVPQLAAAIHDSDPSEYRKVVARTALEHCQGRTVAEEGPVLALMAYFAYEDGDLERARYLNESVALRTPSTFALKRHNRIRINGEPVELIASEQHHLETLMSELPTLGRDLGGREKLLAEAARMLA